MAITVERLQIGHMGYGLTYGYSSQDFLSGPNSAGGISVRGRFTYKGTKTIKYITLRFVPYNNVGDMVQCSIKNCSEYGVRCTGPYKPGSKDSFFLENAWYNASIKSVKLARVLIEYMDGTTEVIQGSEVPVSTMRSGCYVATCVYGSYDCPQVWTLRRYRDDTLASTWYGRAFIHTYYAVSPTLVKWFGNTAWFRKLWKGKLDRMVARLQSRGVASAPYQDRSW